MNNKTKIVLVIFGLTMGVGAIAWLSILTDWKVSMAIVLLLWADNITRSVTK